MGLGLGLFTSIIVGIIAGWLAEKIMKRDHGLFTNLVVGVVGGLIGGIIWNLFTWLLGMPSSSSHALFGGLIGAAFAAMGTSGVEWSSIAGKIVIPAVASPIIAAPPCR